MYVVLRKTLFIPPHISWPDLQPSLIHPFRSATSCLQVQYAFNSHIGCHGLWRSSWEKCPIKPWNLKQTEATLRKYVWFWLEDEPEIYLQAETGMMDLFELTLNHCLQQAEDMQPLNAHVGTLFFLFCLPAVKKHKCKVELPWLLLESNYTSPNRRIWLGWSCRCPPEKTIS